RRLVRHVAETLEPDQFDQAESIHGALCDAVAQCIPVAPPIQSVAGTRRVVALVGPTGVGKTTTVAKLAANFKLAHGVRVGLVTVDTYRTTGQAVPDDIEPAERMRLARLILKQEDLA